MPLLDHFHPPLSKRRHWENLHSAWANALRDYLNDGVLPPRYVAEVQISIGSHVEVDVATLEEEADGAETANGNVAVWAPPRPHTAALNFTHPDLFEVQVLSDEEGPRLVAAVELVSPGNKDRHEARHAFAVKCASYLQQGISVVIVDVVTLRGGNLHAQLLDLLQVVKDRSRLGKAKLYAAGYRTVSRRKRMALEYWTESLAVGAELPTMPLWIQPELCVPLELGQPYRRACVSSRIDVD
jgi:hypothetical protein